MGYNRINDIFFRSQINHRVLQSGNSPCPLLAVINCLLLKKRAQFKSSGVGIFPITFAMVIKFLRDEMQTLFEKHQHDEDKIIQIAQVIDLFPTFDKGLDINLKFSDCNAFERNEIAHQIFDIDSINMYHSWVVDP